MGLSVFSQVVAVGPFYIPSLKPVCLKTVSIKAFGKNTVSGCRESQVSAPDQWILHD